MTSEMLVFLRRVFPGHPGIERIFIMTNKTDRELDLENLQQLQNAGKIDDDINLEEIADKLPKWRKNNYSTDS